MYFSFTHTSSAFKAAVAIRVPFSTTNCFRTSPIGPRSLNLQSTKRVDFSCHSKTLERGRVRCISSGICVKPPSRNVTLAKLRSFSSSAEFGAKQRRSNTRLPWLAANKAKEVKGVEVAASRSSWEESADRLDVRTASKPNIRSWEDSAKRGAVENERPGSVWIRGDSEKNEARLPWFAGNKAKEVKGVEVAASRSSWEQSAERLDVRTTSKPNIRSWEDSAKTGAVENERPGSMWIRGDGEKNDEKSESGDEVVDDPRWDKIKTKVARMGPMKGAYEIPEIRRWNRQEEWGRKTFKEANSQSTLPKMIGEAVYGVGPVLAALSANRREFYALYIQEGLDLSSNNRKKKDKKGFEKILRTAEKNGIAIKDASKHDLNMIVDNRPHQGLLLDASPLEMVRVHELDCAPIRNENGPLWVALDEVTDPQNLGAIIRSAYFFGASGVVLCAKNSAPLSGVVSKASAGSLEVIELRSCKNMMQFLTSSVENGWRVLGGSISSKAVPLNKIAPGAPTILVLGSEGVGLRPLVERSCTDLVKIPGNFPVDVFAGDEDLERDDVGHDFAPEDFRSFLAVESLNVSVAAGVMLHHLIGNCNTDSSSCEDQVSASL